MRAIIDGFGRVGDMGSVDVSFQNAGSIVQSVTLSFSVATAVTGFDFFSAARTKIKTYATNSGYTVADSDIIAPFQAMGSPAWVDGVYKKGVAFAAQTKTVSGGQAVFYLTDDGTASGNPVFSEVYQNTLQTFFNDTANSYQVGIASLSGDLKTLTLNVNKLGSVLLGIIQFVSAANGQSCSIVIFGKRL